MKAKIRAARCHPMPMETRGVGRRARPDHARADDLDLEPGAARLPQRDRGAFGLGQNQVRAIAPEVGGGFGCKFGAYHEDYIADGAWRCKLNRPGEMDRDAQRALPGHQSRP